MPAATAVSERVRRAASRSGSSSDRPAALASVTASWASPRTFRTLVVQACTPPGPSLATARQRRNTCCTHCWMSSTGFDGDWDLPRSRVLSGCGVVVLGLELNGRDKADLAVKAAVIEPVDVLGDRDLQVVDGAPR